MKREVAFSIASIAALCLLIGACERDQHLTSPTNRSFASLSATGADSAVDILRSWLGPPATLKPADTSASALEAGVQSVGGLAFISLKSPTAPRSVNAGGWRAAISATDAKLAVQTLLSRTGLQLLEFHRMLGIVRARVAPSVATALRGSSFVDFVEPAADVPAMPEPHYPGLPAMSLTGIPRSAQSGSQVTPWNDIQINAPTAWSTSTGLTTKVMMIFRGLQNSDSDFPTVPGGNCGGYLHACGGAPYANGTLQFGVLVPRDNSFGIVGVAPGVQGSNIYLWNPYRSQIPDTISINSEVDALNSAVASGVKVIFTDIIHSQSFQTEATAIAQAYAAGATIVTGMWIAGQYDDTTWPGSYPGVIAVSGVGPTGSFAGAGTCDGTQWATGSDYGPMVMLAAPISAYSTYGNGGYYDLWNWWPAHICHPSLSAAHVAGVAALLRDLHPSWTSPQITQALIGTASGGGTRISDYYGYGLVNAAAAVNYVPPPPPPPTITVVITGPNHVPAHHYCTWSAGAWGGTDPYTYSWTVNGNPAGDGTDILSITTPGSSFTIAVTATDANGFHGWTSVSVSIGGTFCAQQ